MIIGLNGKGISEERTEMMRSREKRIAEINDRNEEED